MQSDNNLGTKHYINLSDACSWFGFFIIVFALHVHRCIEALKRVLSWTFSLRIFGEDKKKKNVMASLWCCRQTWSSFAQTEVKSQLVTLAPENWSSLGADNSWGQIYRPTFHPNRDLCQLCIKCLSPSVWYSIYEKLAVKTLTAWGDEYSVKCSPILRGLPH